MLSDLPVDCAAWPNGPFFATLALALAACNQAPTCEGVSPCTTESGTVAYAMSLDLTTESGTVAYAMSLDLGHGRQLQATLCDNTCPNQPQFASDNDCDDGGIGAEYDHCGVIGTDCTDCGSRLPSPPPPPPPPSPPPPLPPSPPPDVAFSPGTVVQGVATTISISGAGVSAGDTLVFLCSVRLQHTQHER